MTKIEELIKTKTKMSKEEIERMIIKQLNKTEHLSKKDFDALAESIIDYIDEISRSKKPKQR